VALRRTHASAQKPLSQRSLCQPHMRVKER
jgi:hypothetical protein